MEDDFYILSNLTNPIVSKNNAIKNGCGTAPGNLVISITLPDMCSKRYWSERTAFASGK